MFDFFFAASGTTLYIIFYICCKPIYSNNFVKVRFPSVPCICLMVIIQFYTVLPVYPMAIKEKTKFEDRTGEGKFLFSFLQCIYL